MNFQNVQFEASYGLFQQIPPCEMPEFAFSGRSNVGKSSLINKLFNRKQLARVSAMPGKTSTINFFRLITCGLSICPAMATPKFPKERKLAGPGCWRLFGQRPGHCIVFQLIEYAPSPDKG